MQNDSAFDTPGILARAIDQLKLVRSVLQRVTNSPGEGCSAAEPSNDSNFVEPEKESLGWLTDLK